MVWPLAVSAAGLGTRIASVARSAAPVFNTAIVRLRGLGAQIGDKADDVIAWARANPANAVMAALTLGSLGVAVDDLFDSPEGKDMARRVMAGDVGLVKSVKILQAGATSQTLNLNIAEQAQDMYTAIEILRWAKSHYGSAAGAVRAHKLQQAFFEMPLEDVETGYETLKL